VQESWGADVLRSRGVEWWNGVGVGGSGLLGEFREEGEDALGGLEEVHGRAVPNSRVASFTTPRHDAPNHLGTQPDSMAGSPQFHFADRPGRERPDVFDEQAGRTDVERVKGHGPGKADLQRVFGPDALRGSALRR